MSVFYQIVPASPEAHLFRIACNIAAPDPAGQRVSLPAWVPGSYLIREFARHIVTFSASCRGEPVKTAKLAKDTWLCSACDGELRLDYEVYAWDLSVRAAHLDTTHGFFNGTSVFVLVHGKERLPCRVEILPPTGARYAHWRVATSLASAGAQAYGFGLYQAADYDELIDHPVEMGAFTLARFGACGVSHEIAISGTNRADVARLERDFKAICEYQIRLFDTKPPFDRYLFLVTVLGEGYGGLEHRASTAIICSRDDLPRAGQAETGEKYRGFLGLVSHEYFHSWNVKRIKPAAFMPYDLARENYTRLLWAFEGITSYYDDLALVRCGLLSEADYVGVLGETITTVLRRSGRLKQSLSDSSFDAWIKFYRQDENSPNAMVSYYAKGSLVALALDLEIRLSTDGARSLDDVMRSLWQRYGKAGIGVPENGIERLAEEVAGRELQSFFDNAVRGTADLPLAELLAPFGVELSLRPAESEADKGGKPAKESAEARAVLGAKIESANADAKLAQVFDGGAAQAAGLSAGDIVTAVDGLRVTAANLEARIASYLPGNEVGVHVFRRDELMTFAVRLLAAPDDTCFLTLKNDADEFQLARRRAWLLS